jgi:Bacteriophage tail sheath protein
MPATLTYPGVYIEEVPSGVRTITAVATSITAFAGRALRGPTDHDDKECPTVVNSFADFVRVFGGLWVESAMTFAVRDFFDNGGSQALVVRLFRPGTGNAKATLTASTLSLEAAHPGAWGNKLRMRVDHETRPLPDGTADPNTFNLQVRDDATGGIEEFRNVSHQQTHARRIDRVLLNESNFVRAVGIPATRPTAHNPPPANQDVWSDTTGSLNQGVDQPDEANDGLPLESDDFNSSAKEAAKQGIFALRKADLFNLLCIPPYKDNDAKDPVIASAAKLCEERRAFLIVDPLSTWNDKNDPKVDFSGVLGTNSRNAALFFPRLRRPNPLRDNQEEDFAPCGAVAGIFARTDAQRGVWKAPAGLDAQLVGVPKLSVPLTDAENGELNPLGVNCLRVQPGAGRVVWGARTMQGSDRLASEWKYIPVRRMALFIEESLYRGTQWVVFEPNDEPLWSQIRLNIGAFMQGLFRQGAFQGATPQKAYFVKCDSETTTQDDINRGIVNIHVGFAPLRPAEFVVIRIQQMAGQVET